MAAQNGEIGVAEKLVQGGADVNEEIGNESILEVAVAGGNCELVRFLVAHGAKIQHSFLGRSQILRARYLKHDDIASLLQEQLAKQSRTSGGMQCMQRKPIADTHEGRPYLVENIDGATEVCNLWPPFLLIGV